MRDGLAKKRQIKNPEVLAFYRDLPCEVCGARPPSDPCHLKSRGAGGDDTYDNVFAACRAHHVLQHAKGVRSFWRQFGARIQAQRAHKELPLLEAQWLED